jgi:hypothetical protein
VDHGDKIMNEIHARLLERLTEGASFEEMLELVLEYKKAGVGQQAIYDVLEEIWREMGCHESEEDNPHYCDVLGGLMDRVWGYCSSKDALWDKSLSAKASE